METTLYLLTNPISLSLKFIHNNTNWKISILINLSQAVSISFIKNTLLVISIALRQRKPFVEQNISKPLNRV